MCATPFQTARAHASVISTSPKDGEHLAASPAQVRILYSEPIVPAMSHFDLGSADGRDVKLPVIGDPHEVRALIAQLPQLAAGAYRITWHIVSADGHPVSGSFAFTVGAADTAQLPPLSPSDPDAMMDQEPMGAGAALTPAFLRGAALSALLAMCGLLGFTAYSENGASPAQKKLIGWLSVSATVLLIVHLVAWLIHVSPTNSLDGEFVAASLTQRVGGDEMVRLLLSALATWALLLARREKLAFAFALAAVIAGGMIGHPAAIHPLIAIPMKAFHLVGVAFWLGGILWLITTKGELLEAASTVSSIALASISVVAVTGIVQTILFLNTPSDLLSSAYGITIIAKFVGLVALAAFGAYHRTLIRKRLVDAPFRSSLRRELMVMIIVVMIGGYLAYVPTPMMR
jgi:copper transport protein